MSAVSFTASFSISAVLMICGRTVAATPINITSLDFAEQLSGPLNQFSVALFNQIIRENDQVNVFLSPFCVSTALSMLMMGSRGNSSQQLRQALHLEHINDTNGYAIHQLFHEMIEERIDKSRSVSLSNFLMIRKESAQESVLQQYETDLQSMYHAKMSDADFITKGPEIMTEANNWVRGSTKGLIKSIMSEPPSQDTRAIILSAISFKGKWKKPFDKSRTKKKTFYNNGVNETQTDFMFQREESFACKKLQIAGEEVQALELAYVNDSMSMIILLPDRKDGLHRILSSNDSEADMTAAFADVGQLNETAVFNLLIPRFKFETEYTLNPILKQLGITDVFSSTAADLSGINGQSNLYVSEVKHKAAVQVDEQGTEAAAATAVHVSTESLVLSLDFTADHPFIFLIREKVTDVILFIGKVDSF